MRITAIIILAILIGSIICITAMLIDHFTRSGRISAINNLQDQNDGYDLYSMTAK